MTAFRAGVMASSTRLALRAELSGEPASAESAAAPASSASAAASPPVEPPSSESDPPEQAVRVSTTTSTATAARRRRCVVVMRLGRRPRTAGSGRDQIVAYDRFRAAAFFAGAFSAAGFTRTRIVLPAPCLTSR